MSMGKASAIKRFIGVHYSVGTCNMRCSYCYLGKHKSSLKEIPFSLDQIARAYSRKRLGGICFINICGDGEPLLHPMIPEIIRVHLEEGHYVMVVTNATLRKPLEKILNMKEEFLARLFFKVSFHYEELVKMNFLEREFENIQMIKDSPCSLSVEYITCDDTLNSAEMDKLKQECMGKMGALPHLNMPRDERRRNLGLLSRYSWSNYIAECENKQFDSEFFEFRKQVFGRRYKDYCYSGVRHLWIDMSTGFSYQCYSLPKLQDFMGETDKPVRYLAVGHNCIQAHCYVAYTFMTLGIAPPPEKIAYRPTYDEIRNRICSDGSEWIKPTMKEAFQMGVEEVNHGMIQKKCVDIMNQIFRWKMRQRF